MPVIFIHALVQRPREAAPRAFPQQAGHHLIKLRLNQVVGVKNLQVFGLVGEIQAAIEIPKQSQIGRIADELTGETFEIMHYFRGAVGGAIIQNNDAVGLEDLARDRFQRLADEGFAVVNRNGGDNFGLHERPD